MAQENQINYSTMSVDELIGSLDTAKNVNTTPADVPFSQTQESEAQNQLNALISQLQPSVQADETTWDEYLWNQAKLGLTDTAALVMGTLEWGVTDPVQYFKKNPDKLFDANTWFPENLDDAKSQGNAWLNKLNKYMEGLAVGDPNMPKTGNKLLDWSGTGVRTITDPGNILFGGAPKTIAATLPYAGKMYTVGVGSEFGGEVGADIAKGTDYETTGRVMGTFAGGVVSPTASTAAAKTVLKPVGEVWNKYRLYKNNPDLVNQQYAGGAAKRFLELAAKEEGLDNLDTILGEFASIKHLLGSEAKGIPLFIQMAENPVIKSQVIRLIKTDPDFKNMVDNEIQNIARHIDMKADIFFGQKYMPVKGIENFDTKIQTRQNKLINARQVIDNQIEKLSQKLIPNVSDLEIGNRISKLVDKRRTIVTEEFTPHYDALKKEAKKAGVFMSAQDSKNIYRYVKDNNLRDIFGKGTQLDKKIMDYLSPRRNEQGMLIQPKLSFEQVDSLKRAINKLKRKDLNRDELRKIKDLEEVVNSGRKNMPGNYNERLEGLDKAYYERVGIPFGSETIKLAGSKKYIEEIAPVLLKNESSVNQFLDAAGDEGIQVASLAYGAKIYDKVVTNGVIDLPKLKALIKKDAAVIDSIPGMRKEIETLVVDSGRLFKLKKGLDNKVKQAEREVSNNFLKRYDGEPDYIDIANKLANRDLTFYKKIQKDMKYLDKPAKKAINQNIQRQFLDHIFNRTDGNALSFLTKPENSRIIKEVFGDTYIEDIKKISKLSDSMNAAQVGKYSSNLQASKLDWVSKLFPGLDLPYLSSQFRDRISSNIMKGTRILSKFKQEQFKIGVDEQLKEVLLDPDAVKKIANLAEVFEFKISNPVQLDKIMGVIGETMPGYMYGAGKVEVRERQEEQGSVIQGIKF